jgi:glycosyltransferase involved in cell wall biosynthesis
MTATKRLAAVFAFAHNEQLLIRDWIEYHGATFGYENLYIVDNCSTDDTSRILSKFRSVGVNVYAYSDYSHRASYLSAMMKRAADHYQYLIPLDVDEFIAVRHVDDKSVSYNCCSEMVSANLHRLDCVGALFEFSYSIHSVERQMRYVDPLTEITEFFETTSPKWNKVFFAASMFDSVFGGNHGGRIKGGDTKKTPTSLCLFHFHYLGAEETMSRALHLCRLKGYATDDDNELRRVAQAKGPSHHRVCYVLRFRDKMARCEPLPIDCGKQIVRAVALRERVLAVRQRVR